MNDKIIWVVYGNTGQYSDHYEWSIAAYPTEELAQKHADAAKKWYEDNDCFKQKWHSDNFDIDFNNPFDEKMMIDYTGTSWDVYPVVLREELPQDLDKWGFKK